MENGRWTTRTLDIHQILARNREREQKQDMQAIPTGAKPPTLGLLTRTVVRSPVIRSIIPARVRHRSKNDVVFVYDDYIVIKEVLGGERVEEDPFTAIALEDVVVMSDFDSPIQAAKVFGLRREPKLPRFPGKYWNLNDGPQSPPETKPEPFHEDEIPPQILVLSLASRTLVFLFAYHDVYGVIHFLSSTWPLPAQVPLTEELGVILAVDPKSRAMAVGACENRVTIYALKAVDRMRREVESSEGLNSRNFRPIQEEKHMDVNGVILKMEFLHPPKGDEHHVILLLVIAKDEKTRLVRFEWDCRSSLREIDKKPGQPMPHAQRLPLLLVPLIYGTAFALVYEHELVVYRHILTGNAIGQSCPLEEYETLEGPRHPRRLPMWTQWARPMRPHTIMDNIYLCREDGVIRYIDVREGTDPMISSNYKAGILEANLGSAFATVDLGDESNDLLLAAGEMGDGGMWYFAPRQPIELVGTIRNWTPFRDIAAASTTKSARGFGEDGNTALAKEKSLFVCSGWGPQYGAVTEIRLGTEAFKIGPTIDFEELAEKGVMDMWALADRSKTGIYLMVAHPMDTELILLPSSDDRDPQSLSEIEELDLDVRTVAAGTTADGFLIQVTQSSINAIAQEHGVLPFTSKIEGAAITAASFLTIPARTTVLLMVMRKQDGFYLHHGHFGQQNGRIAFEELGEPTLLRSQASCISIQWVDDRMIAFVGTLAGTLQSYTAEAGSSFTLCYEHKFEGQFSTCDSMAMITSEEGAAATTEGRLIVCGLRNGTIQTLFFHTDRSISPALSLCEKLNIGSTSVKVVQDATRSSRAFLACEQNLYTLEYPGSPSTTNPAIVAKIWMTDPSSPAYRQGPLSYFTQASSKIPRGYSKFGAGSLFCLTGSNLLLADLSSSLRHEMVPRRLPLNGTPTSITYSEHLDMLIVIYTMLTTEDPLQVDGRPDRPLLAGTFRPAVTFLRPNAEPLRSKFYEKGGLDALNAVDVHPGERYLGAMEWFPTDGDKKYHMLVVHTHIVHPANQGTTGRLLLGSLDMDDTGEVEFKLKRHMERGAPIWAMAAYGNSSLIYGCGDDVVLQTFDMSTRRFGTAVKVELRSPVNQISVRGTSLHVSTISSGHYIFEIEGNGLVLRFAGASGGTNTHHICMPERLVMTSDDDCRVAGLWQPPQPRLDQAAPVVFEAALPSSISRFCRMTRPVWQEKYPTREREVIVGSCKDGTLYQLAILDEQSWRLLAFIQNLAMRDLRVCPYPHPLIHERYIEPSTTEKANMHVNGDILLRFVERGGISLLAEMLHKTPDPDKEFAHDSTAEDRTGRFQELVTEVFPASTPGRFEPVIEWIRALLLSGI
ncbi:MAG: hypothetical protein Q9181_006131 [Wetmoreana brouardii]